MRKLLAVAVLILTCTVSTATAGAQEVLFKTPAGIECDIWKVGQDNAINCHLPSGLTLHLGAKGKVTKNHDYWAMKIKPVLRYGRYLKVGKIICVSRQVEFHCDSLTTMHGFKVTAGSYKSY